MELDGQRRPWICTGEMRDTDTFRLGVPASRVRPCGGCAHVVLRTVWTRAWRPVVVVVVVVVVFGRGGTLLSPHVPSSASHERENRAPPASGATFNNNAEADGRGDVVQRTHKGLAMASSPSGASESLCVRESCPSCCRLSCGRQ